MENNKIEIASPIKYIGANVTPSYDKKYGPYNDINDAINKVPLNERCLGLTVGILNNGTLSEYWWQNNIENDGLVLKHEPPVVLKQYNFNNDNFNVTEENNVVSIELSQSESFIKNGWSISDEYLQRDTIHIKSNYLEFNAIDDNILPIVIRNTTAGSGNTQALFVSYIGSQPYNNPLIYDQNNNIFVGGHSVPTYYMGSDIIMDAISTIRLEPRGGLNNDKIVFSKYYVEDEDEYISMIFKHNTVDYIQIFKYNDDSSSIDAFCGINNGFENLNIGTNLSNTCTIKIGDINNYIYIGSNIEINPYRVHIKLANDSLITIFENLDADNDNNICLNIKNYNFSHSYGNTLCNIFDYDYGSDVLDIAHFGTTVTTLGIGRSNIIADMYISNCIYIQPYIEDTQDFSIKFQRINLTYQPILAMYENTGIENVNFKYGGSNIISYSKSLQSNATYVFIGDSSQTQDYLITLGNDNIMIRDNYQVEIKGVNNSLILNDTNIAKLNQLINSI